MKEKNVTVELLRPFQDGSKRYVIKPITFANAGDKDNARCPQCKERVRLHRTPGRKLFDHYEHMSRGGNKCPYKTESAC